MTTKAERDYMGRVAEWGVFLCSNKPDMGMSRPKSTTCERVWVWPSATAITWLCHFATPSSNASPDGIHGQRRAWKLAQVDEIDALAWTLETLECKRGKTIVTSNDVLHAIIDLYQSNPKRGYAQDRRPGAGCRLSPS